MCCVICDACGVCVCLLFCDVFVCGVLNVVGFVFVVCVCLCRC